MAGTSGEPPDPSGSGKRQATSPPEGEGARAKRPGSSAADAALEQRRAELAEVYRAYDALFRASQAAAAAADNDATPAGGAAAPAPDAEEQDAAFLRLLSAATQGSAGARGLAARLLPRFARGHPRHSSAAADALIGLAMLTLSDRPEQQQAAREQAACGLAAVAAAAGAATAGTSGQQATIKLVDFCFKQLRRSLVSSTSGGAVLNGSLPSGSAGSLCSAGSGGADTGLPPQHLWPCLDSCFASHFRVVLAACLHALKNPAEPFYAVAREFIRGRLLAVPGTAAAQSAEAAAEGDDPPLAAAASMDIDGDGAAAGSAAPAPGEQQRPLAAQVLGALQPKEQAWVRSHVEKWSKEVDPAGSQEAFSLLEQLLRHLPAAEGEHTPPGWLSASVGLPTALPSPSAPTPTPVRGAGGAEQEPAAAAAQQQAAQQQRAYSDRGRGRLSRSPSRPLSISRSRSRSLSPDGPALRRGPGRGSGPGSMRGRRRPSDSPPPMRRRTPSPWRTQQRQRSESPWRPQRQRSSSPWRRWSPGPEPRDGQMRRRGSGMLQSSPPPTRGRRGGDGEDGEVQPDGQPQLPRMPPGFPQPVAPPCLAAACLFFQGLPRSLTERELRAECSKHCKAEWAVRPPGLHGSAFVWFKSVRDAARCYEAMCDALPWRERGSPLQLTFVGSEAAPGAPQRPQRPPTHVWVAGVGSQADEAEVLRCCREGDVPPPEHLLRVPARRPGLLLVFREPNEAEAALAAIRVGRPRILGPPAAAPPGGRPGLPPGLGGPAATPAVSGSPQPRGARGSPPQRGGRGERERSEPNGNYREGERGSESAPLPPAEYCGRTLWVGQIPPGLREDALLQLFRDCGELAGYKLLRHTACMFVDFASLAAATEARKRLDGHRVAGGCLRVEFKNENQFWGPGGRPQGPPRDRGAPPGGRPLQPHPPYRDRSAERGRSGRERSPPPDRGRQSQPRSRRGSPERERSRERGELPARRSGAPLDYAARAALREAQQREREASRERAVRSQSPREAAAAAAAAAVAAGAPPAGRQRRRWDEPAPGQQPKGASPPAGQAPPAAAAAATAAPANPGQASQPAGAAAEPPAALPPGMPPQAAASAMQGAPPQPPPAQPPAAPAAQQRPPLHPPPAAAGRPAWHGTVTKSRAPICAAVCEPAVERSAGGWAAGEPQQWPATLDVAHRADLQHVCSQMFAALRPEERAVLRLSAADAAGRQALADFAQYLRSKSRAGVVVLPPLPPQAAGQGMLQRTLYLVPPSPEVCAQLGARWEACTDCMLALAVPTVTR